MKQLQHGAVGLVAISLWVLCTVPAIAASVEVAQGKLSGVTLRNADAYFGIPYAEPPMGELRWRAPLPAKSWAGERKADKPPASCVQALNPPEGRAPWTTEYIIPVGGPVSEDCLYLNVWTPRNAVGKRLPVFVWIHGGALVEGSSTVPIYDGANLAEAGNMVVVAINYRLGPFGFLVHPELTREAGTAGNYGLMDQVVALEWIKANIAAFGGDRLNVTIGGQSAGAGSVLSLIASPAAKDLFVRAIAESGPGLGSRASPLAVAEASGEAFMKAAGANSLADLRRMPADAVLKAAVDYTKKSGVPFRAVIDGRFLPQEPLLAQYSSTNFIDTPILAGYNADEASGFDTSYGSWTRAEIDRQIADFGPAADRARAMYLPNNSVDLSAVGKQLARDRSMATMSLWAKGRFIHSRGAIFLYNYLHVEPGPQSARYGSFHTNEVPYVFQNLIGANRTFGAEDQQVSKLISGYWINYIKTGNPNGPGLPSWPAFNSTSEMMMRIDTTASPSRTLPPEKLDLFEARYQFGGSMPTW